MSESWALFTLRTKKRRLKTGIQRAFEQLYFEHRRGVREVSDEELRRALTALSDGVAALLDKRISDVQEARAWLLEGLDGRFRAEFERSWIFSDYEGDRVWFQGRGLVEALVPEEYQKSRDRVVLGWMRSHDAALFGAYMYKLFNVMGFDEVECSLGDDYQDD